MKAFFSIITLIFIFNIGRAQNVGINITQPTYPLTVGANASFKGIAQKTGPVEVGFFTSANGAFLQTWSNHPLLFSTNNSSAQMILTTGGNLGIGTTTPTARLDVDGSLRIRGGNPATNRVLKATDSNGNATWSTQPTKTLIQYIAHAAFFPENSFEGYTTINNIGRRPNNSNIESARMLAPLQLPVGSRIKEIVWMFNDMSNSQDFYFSIHRQRANGEIHGIINTYSSGSSAGQLIRSVAYPTNYLIEENDIHWLMVTLDNWPIDNSMFIVGAKITYEIPL